MSVVDQARVQKVDVAQKFLQVDADWSPHIVAELNGQYVKVAKLFGAFDWHSHADEDELFWVMTGQLQMHFRDHVVTVNPGEFLVVPRGVEHRPVCKERTEVVLFEPKSTVNTGDDVTSRTVTKLPWL